MKTDDLKAALEKKCEELAEKFLDDSFNKDDFEVDGLSFRQGYYSLMPMLLEAVDVIRQIAEWPTQPISGEKARAYLAKLEAELKP